MVMRMFCSQTKKRFILEDKFNKQQDKRYARMSADARKKFDMVQGGHLPALVILTRVSHRGATTLHFHDKGGITGAKVHQEDVFEKAAKHF